MNEPNMKDDASPRPVSRTLGDLVDEMAARRPAAEASYFATRCSIMRRSKRVWMPSPGHFSRWVFGMATGSHCW
jgi:hypothetical protein